MGGPTPIARRRLQYGYTKVSMHTPTLFTPTLIGATLVSGALVVMFLIALYNLVAFPRLRWTANSVPAHGQPTPPLSILIPARDEAHQIGETVRALLSQAYPCFEIIVLDDHSRDGTAQAAHAGSNGDPRFRLVQGAALPPGWGGKNWACHQLAHLAQYDHLLFTDADVQWRPDALAALMHMQQTTQADLFTVWPTQLTVTWGERLVVPLMAFAVLAYLPVYLVHHTPYALAAAANGQCMLFRRRAYQTCGGHAAIRDRVLDDVLLAQRVKAAGGQLRMADGAGLIACRMYDSWRALLHGYAKNILAGHGSSLWLLGLSTLFHLTLFLAPWLWLAAGGSHHWPPSWPLLAPPFWPLWPLALILLSFLIRGMTAYSTRQRLCDSLGMPISVLLMSRIAWQALWWQMYDGAPQWKGRKLPRSAD